MKNSINSFNIIENLESGLRVMLNIFLAFPTKPSKMSLPVYTFPADISHFQLPISCLPFPIFPFPPMPFAYPFGLSFRPIQYFRPQLSHFLSPDFPFPPFPSNSLPLSCFLSGLPLLAYVNNTVHCISSKQHNL
jgi:hypothetical protein